MSRPMTPYEYLPRLRKMGIKTTTQLRREIYRRERELSTGKFCGFSRVRQIRILNLLRMIAQVTG